MREDEEEGYCWVCALHFSFHGRIMTRFTRSMMRRSVRVWRLVFLFGDSCCGFGFRIFRFFTAYQTAVGITVEFGRLDFFLFLCFSTRPLHRQEEHFYGRAITNAHDGIFCFRLDTLRSRKIFHSCNTRPTLLYLLHSRNPELPMVPRR